MSTSTPSFLTDDPRNLKLVRGLKDKTLSGKLVWTKGTTDFCVSLRDGTAITFVTTASNSLASILTGNAGWLQFSVRQRNGNEILRVENSASPIFALSGPSVPSELRSEINMLFAVVFQKNRDELDSVLNELDQT